eukprot:CAMPEP_0117647844 /NCGR_PEP_ID=MMETSP0804-20121206/65_1 /TAXON_ID=1074897 /ORGANISM="Tetraselmis astigmatica, Strain CCMP880" /LENGTH=244 /DNA_ID=CAMNT_0005453361 /DNA_START=338 /DNA_END=1073 /DNA_ORIENTATION=-
MSGAAAQHVDVATWSALVACQDIIPDATNREYMGLSLEHTHFIAAKISREGFKPRSGTEGHDIPVLVRDSDSTPLGALSLSKWRQHVEDNPGFPPVEVSEAEFFTSLGNGHFSQALNLFRCGKRNVLTGHRMQIGDDTELQRAIRIGVPSVVLKPGTPRPSRKAISILLNRLHNVRWDLGDDGELHITTQSINRNISQAEALGKVLDAEELSVLVRSQLGIDVTEAQEGYKSQPSFSKKQHSKL